MPINKTTFLKSIRNICLVSVILLGFMTIVATGGGGDGSTGTTSDTTGDTTDGTTESLYDPDSLPTPGEDFEYFNINDYVLANIDPNPTTIEFGSVDISGDRDHATNVGNIVTINSPGVYNITGTITDGQIKVITEEEGDVWIILQNANITCSNSAPIYIESAERVIIYLEDGTANSLTDGDSSSALDGNGEVIDAALYSQEDLVICGAGTLTVNTNYKDGIKSKDGLIIDLTDKEPIGTLGTINVTSADDGIIGKNYISVEDGNIYIIAGGDGLRSSNEGDITQGFIYVTDGLIDVDAGADAIQVETHIVIDEGTFDLYTGGGVIGYYSLAEEDTAKGLKSPIGITIRGGVFTINTADDAIHSNDTIIIHDGDFDLASGDDAIHADLAATVNDGVIDVSTCYEGIEAAVITINGGDMYILSTDDGLNVAGGVDTSGMMGGRGMMPGDQFMEPVAGQYLYIYGGYIVVDTGSYLDPDEDGDSDSGGDGLDINGSVTMTGGTLIVNSTYYSYDGNGAMDSDGGFKVTGGFIIGAGNAAMAQVPGGQGTTQCSVLVNLDTVQAAGTLFHIEAASDGTDIVTFAPADPYNSVAFSSPDLVSGSTYDVYIGGSHDGTVTDGIYGEGTYTTGSYNTSFTASISTTTGGMAGGGGQPGG